jgi:hypothetical protein
LFLKHLLNYGPEKYKNASILQNGFCCCSKNDTPMWPGVWTTSAYPIPSTCLRIYRTVVLWLGK